MTGLLVHPELDRIFACCWAGGGIGGPDELHAVQSGDGGPGCGRIDGVRGMRGGDILGGGGDELHGVSGGGGGCGQRSVDGVCVVWGRLSFGGGCEELHTVPGGVG